MVRTYGSISDISLYWVLKVEPHVATRLKRVFANINKHSHGHQMLSKSPANARELLWFMQRYPLEVSANDLAELNDLANEHLKREDLISQISAGDYVPPKFDMAIQPREYQRVAADMAMRLGRLLIADQVGLGKTISSICTLTDPANLPALIVTLTHLPRQWKKEIERCLPGTRVHVLKKGTPYDICKGEDGEKVLFPDVIISNYHKLGGWAETLAGVVKAIIFDEAHELRRNESSKYAAAKHIASQTNLRIGLTATPIFGMGGEMHNVISVLDEDCLGTRDEFVREWCTTGYGDDRPKVKDPKAFGAFLREQGIMIRRTRSDVGRELESLNKIIQTIEADLDALSKIEDSAAELAKIILSQQTMKKGVKMQAAEQLSNVLRLATAVAKAPYVADFVRLLVESGESVLLFGWHREFYSVVNSKLADLNPVMYTGSESDAQKSAARDKFVNGESKIMIMSLRSGAGLDGLQHVCRTVVFGELDWAPGQMEQAAGRIHRDGQRDPVMAYYLVSDYGSDPTMIEVLGVKRSQLEGIRNPEADLIEAAQLVEHDIAKLAASFLTQRNLAVTEPENLSNIIQLRPTDE